MGYFLKCVGPHWWLVDFKLKSTGKVTLEVVDVFDKQGLFEVELIDVVPVEQGKLEVDILNVGVG